MYIWGKGRAAGRVGSDILPAIAARVGSGQRFAGSGRVGSKKSDPWTTLNCVKRSQFVYIYILLEFFSFQNASYSLARTYQRATPLSWVSEGWRELSGTELQSGTF